MERELLISSVFLCGTSRGQGHCVKSILPTCYAHGSNPGFMALAK